MAVATLNNLVDINESLHESIVLISKVALGAGLVALGSGGALESHPGDWPPTVGHGDVSLGTCCRSCLSCC